MTEDRPSPPPAPPPPPPPLPPSHSPTAGQDLPASPTPSSQAPHPPPKHTQDLNYMHRPPRIAPNYGKKPRGVLPKSSVSRVLLYDNVTQQQMLDVKMNHLKSEQVKTGRVMDMHRKSFMVRCQQRRKHMAETTLHVSHSLPTLTLTTHAEGGAGAGPQGARRGVRKAWTDPQDTAEPQDQPRTPRSVGGGSEKGGEGGSTLPSLTRQRYGASSSQGFSLHPSLPPVPAGTQRGPHTAATVQREGQDALPDISPRTSARSDNAPLLHMDQSTGLTRVMHTFPQRDSRLDRAGKGRKGKGGKAGAGGGEGGGKMTEDERYRKLERMLVRVEPPNEGYLELSPSFHTPRQPMTFTRPSSFHSSIYRSSSSLSPGRVIIGSLLPYIL
ncbi:hypothetical protein ACOMHN_026341 [Nucella lapillus]